MRVATFFTLSGLVILGILACASSVQIKPTHDFLSLPAMFGDHMVVQQDQDIFIWGWGTPGRKVVEPAPPERDGGRGVALFGSVQHGDDFDQ